MKPLWLRHLEGSPEAWQDFAQWIEQRKVDAQKAVNEATSWETYLAARAKREAYVDLGQVSTAAEREEREREAYRGRALGSSRARGAGG